MIQQRLIYLSVVCCIDIVCYCMGIDLRSYSIFRGYSDLYLYSDFVGTVVCLDAVISVDANDLAGCLSAMIFLP